MEKLHLLQEKGREMWCPSQGFSRLPRERVKLNWDFSKTHIFSRFVTGQVQKFAVTLSLSIQIS